MPAGTWSALFQPTSQGGPPLRVGVAVNDELTMTKAQESILADIRSSWVADIVLVVAPNQPQGARRDGFLWTFLKAVDRRRTSIADDPDEKRPIGLHLPELDVVMGEPATNGRGSARLDVLLDFTQHGVEGPIGAAARYGVWAFETTIALQERLIVVRLLSRRSRSEPTVLATGVFASDPLAVSSSLATAWYGSTHMVIQKLVELQSHDWAYLETRAQQIPAQEPPAGAKESPTSWEVIRWIGPEVSAKIWERFRRRLRRHATVTHWRIAIRKRQGDLAIGGGTGMSGFTWLESPPGRLHADPFLIEHDGRTWLFFEDFSYADRRGVIAVAEVAADGIVRPGTTVVSAAGHLSYPYVFTDAGDVYMIPESGNEDVVRLYRATTFPYDWQLVADLYTGRAVDTSAWTEAGRWWFFTTLREPRGGASMLMLFGADDLSGRWESHPANPVSLDVRDARGAGRIFLRNGRPIRPSQDCGRTYGFSFGFNEIVALTNSSYLERRLNTVLPDWHRGLSATHTYSRTEAFEATDGRIERPRRLVM